MTVRRRFLEERSFLKFHFPLGKDSKAAVTLPFYENPIIRESKQSNLKRYTLLSNPSELYSYLGAKSRKLSVRFNITLPHLYESLSDLKSYINLKAGLLENKGANQKRFFKPFSSPEPGADLNLETTWNLAFLAKRRFQDLLKENGYRIDDDSPNNYFMEFADTVNDGISTVNKALSDFWGGKEDEERKNEDSYDANRTKIKNVMLFWINIVRAGCLTSKRNPALGPPIIRLTHGLMYRDIPTICSRYSIDVDQDAGYDLKTLLPRRIIVSMELEEVRRGEYEVDITEKLDGMPNYEDVLDYGTTDPDNLWES